MVEFAKYPVLEDQDDESIITEVSECLFMY